MYNYFDFNDIINYTEFKIDKVVPRISRIYSQISQTEFPYFDL